MTLRASRAGTHALLCAAMLLLLLGVAVPVAEAVLGGQCDLGVPNSCGPGEVCADVMGIPGIGVCQAGGGGADVGGVPGGLGGAPGGGGGIWCPPDAPPDPARPLRRPLRRICLLQPLDAPGGEGTGTTQLRPGPGIQIFFDYFNLSWPWILGIAAGIAVLQAIAGGVQIMISGGAEQRNAGQTRLLWALGGLVLVALAGFILRVLNPTFFR